MTMGLEESVAMANLEGLAVVVGERATIRVTATVTRTAQFLRKVPKISISPHFGLNPINSFSGG